MHYFLFIRLEGFYARAHHPTHDRPLVIHRDKRVIDVDDKAAARQVYRGMPLAEAKAILQEAAFVPWEEEAYRAAQEEWLTLCAEISDTIEPDEQHSAWIDLSLHPDGDALANKLVERIHEQLGLRSATGAAHSKWIAKLFSFYPAKDPNLSTLLRLESLKTRCLTPVEPDHRARLEFLGYPTIGEVARVPLSVLRSQFGEAATHIRMCARGGYFEPVEACFPPNSLSERIGFEGSIDDLIVLDNGLKRLAHRLSERLTKEDRQSKDLVVTLEHEDFRTTIRKRSFTKPIQNYAAALSSLRLLLDPAPEEPIVAVRARLENVAVSERVQRELTGRTSSVEREHGAMSAFQHIRTVFGDSAILTGNQIVEPRRKQVLKAWKDATGWV